jgi:DinB superfamily
MDTITFIRQAVTQAHERLMASLEGLTEADVTWRPAANANTILEIVWHVARVDDRLGRRAAGLGPELWDRDGWSGRLGSVKDVRGGEAYQFLKDHGVQPPRLDDIKAYLDAVHRDTLERLRPVARRPRSRAGPSAARAQCRDVLPAHDHAQEQPSRSDRLHPGAAAPGVGAHARHGNRAARLIIHFAPPGAPARGRRGLAI